MKATPIITKQSGVVLMVSLFFLLLLALLALTVIETNTLQLEMAANDEHKMEVQHRALAIIDAILDEAANTPLIGGIGYRVCASTADPNSPGCDEYLISIDDASLLDASSGAAVDYYVDRVGPLAAPMPFFNEEVVSSAISFTAARQEITVVFDRTEQQRGYSHVSQGYMRLIASPGAISTLSN